MVRSEEEGSERVDIMVQSFFESRNVPPDFAIGDLLHRMQIFLLINTSAFLNLWCLGSSILPLFILSDSFSSSIAPVPSSLAVSERLTSIRSNAIRIVLTFEKGNVINLKQNVKMATTIEIVKKLKAWIQYQINIH